MNELKKLDRCKNCKKVVYANFFEFNKDCFCNFQCVYLYLNNRLAKLEIKSQEDKKK